MRFNENIRSRSRPCLQDYTRLLCSTTGSEGGGGEGVRKEWGEIWNGSLIYTDGWGGDVRKEDGGGVAD